MRVDPTSLHDRSFDLLVVGAGLQGATLAVAAAARGVSVLLIDRRDFASGGSAHGSRRLQIDLSRAAADPWVRVALAERERLLREAPHLVRPLPVLHPRFGDGGEDPTAHGRRLAHAHGRAGRSTLPAPATATADECLRLFPGLRAADLRGGVLFFEAAVQDGRLNLALLDAAARRGAVLASYVELVEVASGAVRLLDRVAERDLLVRPRHLVVAAGVHSDEVRRRLGVENGPLVQPRRGLQLVLDPVDCETALAPLRSGEGPWVVPQSDGILCAGPARPVTAPNSSPPAAAEIEQLRAELTGWLDPGPEPRDVRRAWYRWHAVPRVGPPRQVAETGAVGTVHTLLGGTLATHRPLAVQALAELLGADARPLAAALPGTAGPRDVADPLWWRHGNNAAELRAFAARRPGLLEPLCPHRPFLVVEAQLALRTQGVVTFADLALRRLIDARGPCGEVACRRRLHEIFAAARPDTADFERDDAALRAAVL